MRVETNVSGGSLDEGAAQRVDDRIRMALGGFVSEITRVRVSLRVTSAGVVCDIRVTLRGRRTLRVSGEARGFDEALDFVAARVGAAVARRFDLERLLGDGGGLVAPVDRRERRRGLVPGSEGEG